MTRVKGGSVSKQEEKKIIKKEARVTLGSTSVI